MKNSTVVFCQQVWDEQADMKMLGKAKVFDMGRSRIDVFMSFQERKFSLRTINKKEPTKNEHY